MHSIRIIRSCLHLYIRKIARFKLLEKMYSKFVFEKFECADTVDFYFFRKHLNVFELIKHGKK